MLNQHHGRTTSVESRSSVSPPRVVGFHRESGIDACVLDHDPWLPQTALRITKQSVS